MSTRELRGAEVLGRVKSKALRLTDAAKILVLSLPADEETLEAVSRGRSEGSAAPQCGKRFEPGEAGRVPAEGSAADPEEVFGNGAGAIWTDAGSGAPSGRGWARGGRRDLATLDASRGVVEPHAETESTPEAESAAGALWRPGAVGWKFPCMV
jgi:hypothetical protein